MGGCFIKDFLVRGMIRLFCLRKALFLNTAIRGSHVLFFEMFCFGTENEAAIKTSAKVLMAEMGRVLGICVFLAALSWVAKLDSALGRKRARNLVAF